MSTDDKFPVSKKQLLGEILIKRQLITQEKLDHALKVQEKEEGFIGEILVKLGYIEERDVVVALIVQCNIPYIAISKYEIDQNIIQLFPQDVVKRCQVVPLDRVGDVLSVVMVNPLDVAIKAELQRLTNCQIAPFIATKTEITKAIHRWYGED